MTEPCGQHISEYPWNPADLSGSFQGFAPFVHEQAKHVLLADKYHEDTFFFTPVVGQGRIVFWRLDSTERQAKWVRDYIAKHYIFAVIHVCEAWVRFASSPNDHTVRQVLDGEIKVSELRPEDRCEVLLVTAESRDGYSRTWTDEIIRNEADGSLRLGACRECSNFVVPLGRLFG